MFGENLNLLLCYAASSGTISYICKYIGYGSPHTVGILRLIPYRYQVDTIATAGTEAIKINTFMESGSIYLLNYIKHVIPCYFAFMGIHV
ncbi:MAG: hypothetical protein KGJ90_06410 [Patescibacteria group bacterium]|nr:hypothetical protein [Patescibacteria group bacterium]